MHCKLFVERKSDDGSWHLVPETEEPRKERWSTSQRFEFLAMLGGVEYEDVPPFADLKGLPTDASPELMSFWKEDCQKPSHLSLAQVLELGEKTIPVTGYLGLEEFEKYMASGKTKVEKAYKSVPRSSIILTNQRMERVINMSQFMDENTYFTLMNWDEKYTEVDKYFWNQMIPKMKMIDEKLDNVRIVFWFNEE